MAPHGVAIVSSHTPNNFNKPRRLSNDNLKRTTSDISNELSKEAIDVTILPPISEIEDAKCECCGMVEEYTHEYIDKVRNKFCGKWICGLCAEAVKEEMEKNGGKRKEALETHMNACFRFNKFGRAYPVLSQAQAMREMLRRSASMDGRRVSAKFVSPKDRSAHMKGHIARSSSCIPAITREMNEFKVGN